MLKSNCCNAPIKTITHSEGTSFWECTACGKGCDPVGCACGGDPKLTSHSQYDCHNDTLGISKAAVASESVAVKSAVNSSHCTCINVHTDGHDGFCSVKRDPEEARPTGQGTGKPGAWEGKFDELWKVSLFSSRSDVALEGKHIKAFITQNFISKQELCESIYIMQHKIPLGEDWQDKQDILSDILKLIED